MSLTGHITRDLLGLEDLELWVPGDTPADPTVPVYALTLDGLQPGGVVKRRQIAESTYVDNAFQVQSSKARVPASFNFFISGYNIANLQDNIAVLAAAVDQKHWQMHVNMTGSGGSWAWRCWDSETMPGIVVPTFAGVYMTLAVSTLRNPIPIYGPV